MKIARGWEKFLGRCLLDYNTSCTPKIKKKNVPECGKIRLPTNHATERKHILHEQYNTRGKVSSIPDEVCRKIWGITSKQKIQ